MSVAVWTKGRRRAALAASVALLAAIAVVSGCRSGQPTAEGQAGAGTTGAAAAGATGPAKAPAASDGPVRVDPNPTPSPPVAAPPLSAGDAAAGAMKPAPGTMSLRFIVRQRETQKELPAGGFEVRLVPLDAIREDGPSPDPASAGALRSATITTAPAPAGSQPIAPSPQGVSGASGAAAEYRGRPEQVLVTQLDGAKWTFLAGVRPGAYAMRITAPKRRMLLEVLTVHPEDRLVERTLEPE